MLRYGVSQVLDFDSRAYVLDLSIMECTGTHIDVTYPCNDELRWMALDIESHLV